MSVQRSPQSKETPVRPTVSQRGVSQAYDYDSDNQIIIRKRKRTDCECNQVVSLLQAFRQDMISALETNLKPIREDLSAVKNQMVDIKTSTEKLLAEHSILKEEVVQLQAASSNTDSKISAIETEIAKLKTNQPSTQNQTDGILASEKIINEMRERERRRNNLIIVGLPEPTNTDEAVRYSEDMRSVHKTFQDHLTTNPDIVKVIRLGNFISGKVRPVKVCFVNPDEVKQVFRNKNKLPSNIRVYYDQTPTEKSLMKELSKELTQRKENGETDLLIKYIKGTPRIIRDSKNPQPHLPYKETKKKPSLTS